MKICTKCKTPQNDSRTTCVDCGAALGKPIDGQEAEKLEAEIDDKLYSMAERTDDFRVGKFDIALIIVNAVLIVCTAILIFTHQDSDMLNLLFTVILCSVIIIINSVFPKLDWTLTKFRYRFIIDTDNATPPANYFFMRKAVLTVVTVIIVIAAMFITINL